MSIQFPTYVLGAPTAISLLNGDSIVIVSGGVTKQAPASLFGGVQTVFGRTGAVVATSGDYVVGQVTGAAPLASPTLTGTPLAPTAAPGTNTTQLATTAFVLANGGGTITLSGHVTGSGTTSIATTIAAGVVTNAMLAGSIAASKLVGSDIATVGTITAGTWTGTTIAIANGGTGQTSAGAALTALGGAPLASPTFTGLATAPKIAAAVSYGLITADADGATITFDAGASNRHAPAALGANRTLAITNDADGQVLTIVLTQGTGGQTVTWWSGIKWPGGIAPTLSVGAGKKDMITILRLSSGAYLGNYALNF